MNALKCRTLDALYKWRWCACVKHLIYARARTLITCNGKYTEDFSEKTKTKEKEACCLTSSHIPGSV